MSRFRLAWVALASWVLAACGPETTPPPQRPTVQTPPVATVAPAETDPLGPRPAVTEAPVFAPPAPEVLQGPGGLTVWLLERHTLPFVAMSIVVPTGSSSDPPGKGGLVLATANMLDEGAGKRGALDLSRAVEDLGATLSTGASSDTSNVTLAVLKKNLAPACAILGDVVAHPRFEAVEWKRVHDLWLNDLKERASDPVAVARVVARAALFGASHPYGHPSDGTLASAKAVSLDEVRALYRRTWRPDRAVLVVAGDVTKAELLPLLGQAFGEWKAPAGPVPPLVTPPAPKGPWPRVVLVDRPDAPQAVVDLVAPGIAATDPDAPALSRVNAAIGGEYTSRLNQDLREEHGWTYGAFSFVTPARGIGFVTAGADVVTDATAPALKAMLTDLDAFAKKGLTAEEVAKTRTKARADVVSEYEGVAGIVRRLSADAGLGLPPDYEAGAARKRDAATQAELNDLAAKYFDPGRGTGGGIIVVVGPRAKLESQLGGLGPVEVRDTEGRVLPSRP